MEEQNPTESVRKRIEVKSPARGQPARYPVEFRLKAVKFHLEEGFSLGWICQQLKLNKKTVWDWVKRYRESVEEGLKDGIVRGGRAKPKLAPAVKTKIVEIKRQHPSFGVKRIAQLLRRGLFLPGSHEAVRRTLP